MEACYKLDSIISSQMRGAKFIQGRENIFMKLPIASSLTDGAANQHKIE